MQRQKKKISQENFKNFVNLFQKMQNSFTIIHWRKIFSRSRLFAVYRTKIYYGIIFNATLNCIRRL